MKISLSFFIIFFVSLSVLCINAQTKDSVNVQKTDTAQVKVSPDSAAAVKPVLSEKDTLKQLPDSLKQDSVQVKKAEPIIPIYRQALTSTSEYAGYIRQSDILSRFHRYTGSILDLYPLTFERSLGVPGQPEEVLVYGSGFNQTSYLRNGLLYNNRLTNSFDLNNFQSEIIDSVEIIPSSRSFLYGTFNNNAAVNFITKYKFVPDTTRAPYSRIRFYQASDEEAFIDFTYSSFFARKLYITLDVSNKTSDLRFIPTTAGNAVNAYGAWNGTARFRYYLSNKMNITGTYNYVKSNSRLYGGINVDSTLALYRSTNFDSIFVETGQVLNYIERYQKTTTHRVNLDLIGKPIENIKSELNLYYSFDQTEFRQNEYRTENVPFIFNNNKYNLYGGLTRHSFNNDFIGLDASAGFEVTDYDADVINKEDKVNSYFVSGKLHLNLLNNVVVPSVFTKYLNYNNKFYFGLGGDVTFNLFRPWQLYAGGSYNVRPLSIYESYYVNKFLFVNSQKADLKQTTSVEIGSKYRNEFVITNLSLFYRYTDSDIIPFIEQDTLSSMSAAHTEVFGAGLKADFKFWNIIVETNSAYYLTMHGDKKNYRLPEFTSTGSIYYKDILFNSNLDLKAGVTGRYTGRQDFISYDFERSLTGQAQFPRGVQSFLLDKYSKVKPSFTVDISIVGEIRNSVILYVTYENLFGKDYYIVPFYPMYQSGLVVGLAWEFLN